MAPSRFDSRSVTARATAAAITMIRIATKTLGRYAIRPRSRSEMGFDPNTPKASWSTNSMMVQNTSLARMSEGSYLLRASTWRTPPRSTTRSKPARSRTLSRMHEGGHIRPRVLDAALEVNGEVHANSLSGGLLICCIATGGSP
jgi:hypothetical protein